MNNYIDILKKMNLKAIKNKDIPVSCLIIKDNKIISKAYNSRVKNKDPFQHAEILAIKKAAKVLNTYNLKECALITTLKPCKMCEEVIKEAKIKNVYYIVEKNKVVNNKINYIKINDDNYYFQSQIQDFFKDKR